MKKEEISKLIGITSCLGLAILSLYKLYLINEKEAVERKRNIEKEIEIKIAKAFNTLLKQSKEEFKNQKDDLSLNSEINNSTITNDNEKPSLAEVNQTIEELKQKKLKKDN